MNDLILAEPPLKAEFVRVEREPITNDLRALVLGVGGATLIGCVGGAALGTVFGAFCKIILR